MPATALTVTPINRTGVAPVAFANSDPTNSNSFSNDERTWLELSNTDSGSHTATINLIRKVDGQTVTPTVHTVNAGAQVRLGPFPVSDYGSTVTFHCTDATLKAAVYRLSE